MKSSRSLAVWLAAGVACLANAQPQAKPYVLNVYANRIQVPTLVLKKSRVAVPPPDTELTVEQFRISLDAGPYFRPTGMHVQGNDPLDLAVILDLGPEGVTAASMGDHLEAVAGQMNPQDRISLYAFHCNMTATANFVPASAEVIREAVKDAFSAPIGPKAGQEPCDSQQALWDSAQKVMLQLETHRGRHAILIFSNAALEHNRAHILKHVASRASVSVMVIRDTEQFNATGLTQTFRGYEGTVRITEDPLRDLCTFTGGYLFAVKPAELDEAILAVVPDLRSRYILEFPRPGHFAALNHGIEVTVPTPRHDVVLPSGATAMTDSTDPNDPSIIRGAPSPAVVGNRRILTPQ